VGRFPSWAEGGGGNWGYCVVGFAKKGSDVHAFKKEKGKKGGERKRGSIVNFLFRRTDPQKVIEKGEKGDGKGYYSTQ